MRRVFADIPEEVLAKTRIRVKFELVIAKNYQYHPFCPRCYVFDCEIRSSEEKIIYLFQIKATWENELRVSQKLCLNLLLRNDLDQSIVFWEIWFTYSSDK